MIHIAIINNELPNVCSKCSKCCIQSTGALWPDELPDVTPEVIAEYTSGNYVVSAYTNYHGTGYYLQPKMDDKGCVFLTPTGCSFTFENRPRLCQTYIPHEDTVSCHQPQGYTLEDAVRAWKPYENILLPFYNTQTQLS